MDDERRKRTFEELKILHDLPNTFRKDDPELVKIFKERLRNIRKLREEQSKTNSETYVNHWSQKSIGKLLGITAAGYGKYENEDSNLQTIPIRHIDILCDIFDVTRHYLLGYAQQEDCIVELDARGNIVMKDGKPNELHYAFKIPDKLQTEALDTYRDLISHNPMLFSLINILMHSSERTQEVCTTVLSALLENL